MNEAYWRCASTHIYDCFKCNFLLKLLMLIGELLNATIDISDVLRLVSTKIVLLFDCHDLPGWMNAKTTSFVIMLIFKVGRILLKLYRKLKKTNSCWNKLVTWVSYTCCKTDCLMHHFQTYSVSIAFSRYTFRLFLCAVIETKYEFYTWCRSIPRLSQYRTLKLNISYLWNTVISRRSSSI